MSAAQDSRWLRDVGTQSKTKAKKQRHAGRWSWTARAWVFMVILLVAQVGIAGFYLRIIPLLMPHP